ncbi:hypothetical protein [Marinobacter caseinilyticus]|uniref:hypothetical protein n=1 Tax=Marinobacter caseinilyticus TaxID=2692195 RepID=UPI001F21951E|nr:hypothetical protein [Marinobacter caseinilyticus]
MVRNDDKTSGVAVIDCKKILALIVLCGWVSSAAAEDACLASAQSGLERLYCEIVARGEGRGLPSPADFKRNDPQVQALLLRRPAARLGLSVPASSPAPSPTATAPADRLSDPTVEPAPTPPSPSARRSANDRAQSPVAPDRQSGLSGCQLAGEVIDCPNRRLVLASNQANRELQPGALAAGNTLSLASFQGDRRDAEVVRRYLSGAYDVYILKMLAIGLGANTMSFTAFHHAFHSLEDGGVDFAQRMEQTYRLLKEDKKTLAVKARYHNELPQSLAWCVSINREVVVCDNVGTNWVFTAAP